MRKVRVINSAEGWASVAALWWNGALGKCFLNPGSGTSLRQLGMTRVKVGCDYQEIGGTKKIPEQKLI
jgi:hypothetical protein